MIAAAVPLDLYALAILAAGIAQYVSVAQMKYDVPVAAIARALDKAKLLRARTALWTIVLAPLMWTPLIIVTLRALGGIDTISAFGPWWVAANLAFGFAVLAAALVIARRGRSKAASSSLFGRAMDVLSGRPMRMAAEQLEALRRYESDAV
jgi:hypothetical protein